MKIARNLDGTSLVASAMAPPEAICPDCAGVVRLRSRRRMGQEPVYFWRHSRQASQACPGRGNLPERPLLCSDILLW